MRNFERRLADLEKLERAQHTSCRGWVVVDESGAVIKPCGCDRVDEFHKVYVAISPDDWDDNEP